jgi:hypothetical protein
LKINLQVDFVGDIDLGFSIIYIFLISWGIFYIRLGWW